MSSLIGRGVGRKLGVGSPENCRRIVSRWRDGDEQAEEESGFRACRITRRGCRLSFWSSGVLHPTDQNRSVVHRGRNESARETAMGVPIRRLHVRHLAPVLEAEPIPRRSAVRAEQSQPKRVICSGGPASRNRYQTKTSNWTLPARPEEKKSAPPDDFFALHFRSIWDDLGRFIDRGQNQRKAI